MASASKVSKFDSEGLEEFQKSLICYYCETPPRPGGEIYSHDNKNGCHPEIITCGYCSRRTCENGLKQYLDPNLTKFASLIQFWNCQNYNFGCFEKFEAEDLDAHEENCLFRGVTCPKSNCDGWVAFNGIMDHFQEEHPDVKIKHDVLKFKGTLEELKKSTYVLNTYGKPFFPQFYINQPKENENVESMLYIWVRGHGDQTEMDLFEMSIKFFLNGKPRIRMNDLVKAMDFTWDNNSFTGGYGSLQIRVGNIMEYYDVESKEYEYQDFIEFQLKIVSEKLDAIMKDEKIASKLRNQSRYFEPIIKMPDLVTVTTGEEDEKVIFGHRRSKVILH